ncbi:MAG: NAD(P)H-dependent oxidoreductase [Chitinophagales bacterium]|nr:NAD(P)H-dependent oxidoreductase [Chitinophagales bacterium]
MEENKNYHIIAISGSLREESYNTMALKTAQKVAPPNIIVEQISIKEVPFYNEDLYKKDFPPLVNELVAKIKSADGVLIVSPEYNYSIPGVLKNAIDMFSRHPDKPFDSKAVAIMGASTGLFGTARMQYHLRQVMVFLNAWTVNRPEIMIGQAKDKFDANGNLTDSKATEMIRQLLISLAGLSELISKK